MFTAWGISIILMVTAPISSAGNPMGSAGGWSMALHAGGFIPMDPEATEYANYFRAGLRFARSLDSRADRLIGLQILQAEGPALPRCMRSASNRPRLMAGMLEAGIRWLVLSERAWRLHLGGMIHGGVSRENAPSFSVEGCPDRGWKTEFAGGAELHARIGWLIGGPNVSLGLEPFYVYHLILGHTRVGQHGLGLRGVVTVR